MVGAALNRCRCFTSDCLMAKKSGYKNKNIGVLGKKTQWKKGQSGNPNGQPRKLPSLNAVLTRVFGVTKDDDVSKIDLLIEAMYKQAIKKGNVQAANLILDRMHGKPKQSVEVSGVLQAREEVSKLMPFAKPKK